MVALLNHAVVAFRNSFSPLRVQYRQFLFSYERIQTNELQSLLVTRFFASRLVMQMCASISIYFPFSFVFASLRDDLIESLRSRE